MNGGRRWRSCWRGFPHGRVGDGGVRFSGGDGIYSRPGEFVVGVGSNSTLDSSARAGCLARLTVRDCSGNGADLGQWHKRARRQLIGLRGRFAPDVRVFSFYVLLGDGGN